MFGLLTEFGSSPFEFDEDNSDSYFVKLDTSFGEKTIWGVGLKDALSNSDCKVGDNVSVIHNGKEPVKLPVTRKDDTGKEVTEFITKQRNAFVIKHKRKKIPSTNRVKSTARQEIIITQHDDPRNREVSEFNESIISLLRGVLIGTVVLSSLYFYIA